MRYGSRGSLSVDVKRGVWRDHETGEGGGTLDLVMRKLKLATRAAAAQWLEDEGFIQSDKPKPKSNGKAHGPTGELERKYYYTDATGEVVFEVWRYMNPKDFRPHLPSGRAGLPPADKLVVYRLHEIVEAIKLKKTVFIFEGEKDVDTAVEQFDLIATCNQGGTGGGWREQYNETFRDADVVIVPDNDDAGRKHASKVAASLSGIAARVRVLKLWESWKECPEKGDFYDWREAGHTREQLDALVDAASDYTGEASAPALEDFRAYMPAHQYICMPTGEMWPAASVDAKIAPVGKLRASAWLDKNQSVEQMTWAPGLPALIQDKTVTNGGWADKRGYAVYNMYKPPTIAPGDATAAGPWLDHVRRVYPDDADHIVCYLAHRVQRPHEKINHGLVLGGSPGVGKDTLIEPVKRAVGPWNVQEISPQQVLGRFNGFVKSVILRISEARDLGELNRFAFYEHMKIFLAAPPDVIRCDEKNLREHSVFNVVGVIITSNRKDSFYLPADDRRHYVAWTDLTQADFPDNYWDELWGWYEAGGDRHVAAYLGALDLKGFNPKAPPKKTDVFWQIVETNRAPENSQLDDALDELGDPDPNPATPGGTIRPKAVTLAMIRETAKGGLLDWLTDGKNARQIPHRMSECGYVPIQNGAAKDGLWRIDGRRQVIYVNAELSVHDRHAAATALTKRPPSQKGMWLGGGR
jgi:hypothetical protein